MNAKNKDKIIRGKITDSFEPMSQSQSQEDLLLNQNPLIIDAFINGLLEFFGEIAFDGQGNYSEKNILELMRMCSEFLANAIPLIPYSPPTTNNERLQKWIKDLAGIIGSMKRNRDKLGAIRLLMLNFQNERFLFFKP